MLSNLKSILNKVLGENLTKEQADALKDASAEIVTAEEKFKQSQKEYDELKTDYIKVIKNNTFQTSAQIENDDSLSFEDIAKSIKERNKKQGG